MFDLRDHLHHLRRRETCWLQARRARLVSEQRRLRVEELAITRVLDERGALDATAVAAEGVSARAARETVETARALESLPRVAAAAHAGALSGEQLGHVVRLADETNDAEWADRAPGITPTELARRARLVTKPTLEKSRACQDARFLRMWWSPDQAMLHLRGALPAVEGARVEAAIAHAAEQCKPPAGQAWEPFERRAADALVAKVAPREASCGPARAQGPSMAARPVIQAPVRAGEPATIAGIPIPDARLEQLLANSTVEPVLVDADGVPLAFGRRYPGLSPKITRAIILRDGECQCGLGCGIRHGLEIHHLVPRSWGGTDDPSNLAALFPGHHPDFIPHGPWALVGNPNVPGGLRRVLYADLTADEAARYGLPPPPGKRPRR